MKTKVIRYNDVKRQFHVVDVEGAVVGRVATTIASLLIGKRKLDFTPHVDNGDSVVVINAAKVRLTGRKEEKKYYKRFSGYPGGLNEIPYKKMIAEKPEEVIKHAVKGMLPKTKLGKRMFRRLKVYPGDQHPHAAQIKAAVKEKGK